MKIIIAGAGAVGTHLAKLLSDEKQDIILMDENEEKLSKLDSNFDLMTVNASPTSISGLKNAGVAGADLFIGYNFAKFISIFYQRGNHIHLSFSKMMKRL